MADNNKLFDILTGAAVLSSLKTLVSEKEVETPKTWPGKYTYTILFRMVWSIFTIIYVNMVLEHVYHLGPDYLSLFWGIPLAFIPLLGSFYVPLLCIIFILCGIPTDPTQTKEYQIHEQGYPTCFSPGCSS